MDHNWKFIKAQKVVGSEDQFIITYNFPPGPEHISRARHGLVMVTTKGYLLLLLIYLQCQIVKIIGISLQTKIQEIQEVVEDCHGTWKKASCL